MRTNESTLVALDTVLRVPNGNEGGNTTLLIGSSTSVPGTILTAMVQSSAALMAITMVLCSTGAITIYQGIALVMGENIGTTVTANLAAMSANTQARRTALAHLFFNVFGVVWVLIFFFPFVRMVCGIVGLDPTAAEQSPTQLSFALATFHTFFNVINTAVLIWFIPQIEKFVCFIIKPRKFEVEDEFRLQFIKGGIMKTPEIAILQAQKEIDVFGEKMQFTFGLVKDLSQAKEEDEFKKIFDRIEKNEDLSDRMEKEIGQYLGQVGDAHLSDESKEKLRAMLRQIGELESVGDSCFNLARILSRKREHKVVFREEQENQIIEMYKLVDAAMTRMNQILKGPREEFDLSESEDLELRINGFRNQLKRQNIVDLDNHIYDYENGTVYMDLINEFEKTADYVINVVEARLGVVRNSLRFRGVQLDTDTKRVMVDGETVPFSKTEFEMLRLFMENPNKEWVRRDFVQALWSDDPLATSRTVDAAVTRIRRKLGPYGEAIVTRGAGYVFEE